MRVFIISVLGLSVLLAAVTRVSCDSTNHPTPLAEVAKHKATGIVDFLDENEDEELSFSEFRNGIAKRHAKRDKNGGASFPLDQEEAKVILDQYDTDNSTTLNDTEQQKLFDDMDADGGNR